MIQNFTSLRKNLLIFILTFLLTISVHAQNIVINEFLASNTKTNISPVDSEYADWIELRNLTLPDINIGGYFLTDDLTNPAKWKIPENTVVPADGFVLFWADDRDSSNQTNFKLNKDGEALGLFNPDTLAVDTINFGEQADDISFGRLADNINKWSYFETPTPLSNNISDTTSISPQPQFSLPGGFYSGSLLISISTGDSLTEIRYTLDGTPPDGNSLLYSSIIEIDSTISLRARSYKKGKAPGEIITYTYFINEEVHLPVISLVTDPANLFSDSSGIYVTGTNGRRGDCDPTIRNVNQDWERPVHIEFYETTGEIRINQDAGIKIFGGCSRTRYPQKSFALYARSEYGKGSFDYQFFKNKPIKKFEGFLLRSSSDDQVSTMFRDGLAHTVLSQIPETDYQAYRPAVVYINGVYWGIHNIREKVNEHYLEENYNASTDEVNLLERNPYDSWNTIHGSAKSYNSMIDYIKTHTMSNDNFYKFVEVQMDIDQFINYEIGHIYLGERDWPGNNIRFWKADSGKYSKWRWIDYDMDQTFQNLYDDNISIATATNGPGWPNPPWATLLLRELLKNINFKNRFIQRYAYMMSTIFEPQNLIHIIDSMQLNIAAEIPRHITKWGGKKDPDFHESWEPRSTFNSVEEWSGNVDTMRIFANLRPQNATQHLLDYFKLSGTAQLTIKLNINEGGKVKIVNMDIPDSGYSGAYFKGIPLNLEAIPEFGYRFVYWKRVPVTLSNPNINIFLTGNETITAYFEKEELADSSLVIINEINYHSSDEFDTGDWIELYNRRSQPVDLSGWFMKDEEDSNKFIFPQGSEIKSNGYLVIGNNSKLFASLYQNISNYTGDFKFGLSGSGEVIRLFTKDSLLVDSVRYDNNSPWPNEADGTGATLELMETKLNNDIAANWISVLGKHGTPGAVNSKITGVGEDKNKIPEHFELYANYPNPFNPSTRIRYAISKLQYTTLKIYDVLGNEIASLVNDIKEPGIYEVEFRAIHLSSGVYFYRLHAGSFVQTRKFLLLK